MTRHPRHGKCIPVCVYDKTSSSWKVHSSVRICGDILVMESLFQCAYMTRHTRHGKCIPVCVYTETYSSLKVHSSVRICGDILVMESVFQ